MDFIHMSDWGWQACSPCPIARAEGSGVQINGKFYILGGFQTIDQVGTDVHVLDLATARWIDQFPMHPGMAHTHVGLTADDRYLYCAAGQKGGQCSPAIAEVFALDTITKTWTTLPDLPQARYAPAMQLWNGRLHVLGGSMPDRGTPAVDHWSLAVKDGRALETSWRAELSVPKGGPHRTSMVMNNELFIFGGELGDVKPVAGDPAFTCDWHTPMEIVYGDTYKLNSPSGIWERLADMPYPTTHMESSLVQIGTCAVMAGGNRSRDKLSDLIQIYDTRTNAWRLGPTLPFRMKTTMTYYDGWLYVITGQKARSRFDADPHRVLNTLWRRKFTLT